eukprot:SAG25_NODE_317_length_9961_cov_5.088724_6_plen_46_part_00
MGLGGGLCAQVCMPGDTVVRQGDMGEEMYFIREGCAVMSLHPCRA